MLCEIQITEIADRAHVSRPAFYLHYSSKEKLLLSHSEVVFDEFRAELAREIAAGRVDRQKFCMMLFEYWERYADTLKLVIQADVSHRLLEQLRDNQEAVTLAPPLRNSQGAYASAGWRTWPHARAARRRPRTRAGCSTS